jgi:hypothetical protein
MESETQQSMRLYRYESNHLNDPVHTSHENFKPIKMVENCQAANQLFAYATYASSYPWPAGFRANRQTDLFAPCIFEKNE